MSEKPKLYIVIGVTVLAVVVLGAVIWYRAVHPGQPGSGANGGAAAAPRFKATPLTVAQFPSGFPTNLPIEKAATTTQVQGITDVVSGQQQFDESYVTKLTIAANFAAYKAYFAAKPAAAAAGAASAPAPSWKVLQTVDQPTYKTLIASNGTGIMRVILDYKYPAAHVVTISYIPQPVAGK